MSDACNQLGPLILTTARAYASDKSLATFGTPMLSYEYGRDYPEVTRGEREHPGEDPQWAVICTYRTGLFVVDVDDAAEFTDTATYRLVRLDRTVESPRGHHLYVDARELTLSGHWIKGATIPGADIKGAGRGGFVMGAGTLRPDGSRYRWRGTTDPTGATYEYWRNNVAQWSEELEQALVADGCRIVPVAELDRVNGASCADVDDIISTWGFEPATDDDYERISAGVGTEGHTNSALVAVCHRLLNYAAERPESALGVLWRLEADYESHPGYAGKGETEVRRALKTAYASHVPASQYAADLDRKTLAKLFSVEEIAKIEARVEQAALKTTVVELPATAMAVPGPQRPVQRRRRTTAADIPMKRVEWLWEPYVPKGMLTVLGGMEGSGKTQVAIDLAARQTRAGHSVVMLATEDPLQEVMVPRLIASGADLRLVHFFDAEPWQCDVTIKYDLTELGEFVAEVGAALVIFDPIVAVLGADTDSDNYKEVSIELTRLVGWAASAQVSVLACTHLRKASDSTALNKMMGSRAFTSKPRSVLMTAEHPDEPGMRLLTHAKSNVGVVGVTRGYQFEPVAVDMRTRRVAVGYVDEAHVVSTSRLRWCGNYEMWSAGALAEAAARPPKVPKIQLAAQFVREYLTERGGVALAADVRAAAMAQGFGADMVKSADLKTLAKVTHQQTSGVTPTQHYWSLIDASGKWTIPSDETITEWRERV